MNTKTNPYKITLSGETGLLDRLKHIKFNSSDMFIGVNTGSKYTGNLSSGAVMIGYESGRNSLKANRNVFVGFKSGHSSTNDENNVFIGSLSGFNNKSGSENTFIGANSGNNNIQGKDNIFIGNSCATNLSNSCNNVCIGSNNSNNSVNNNNIISIGNNCAFHSKNCNDDIFIGNNSAYYNFSNIDIINVKINDIVNEDLKIYLNSFFSNGYINNIKIPSISYNTCTIQYSNYYGIFTVTLPTNVHTDLSFICNNPLYSSVSNFKYENNQYIK